MLTTCTKAITKEAISIPGKIHQVMQIQEQSARGRYPNLSAVVPPAQPGAFRASQEAERPSQQHRFKSRLDPGPAKVTRAAVPRRNPASSAPKSRVRHRAAGGPEGALSPWRPAPCYLTAKTNRPKDKKHGTERKNRRKKEKHAARRTKLAASHRAGRSSPRAR